MTEKAGETRQTTEAYNVGVGETRTTELINSDKNQRRWCLIKGFSGLLCHLLAIAAIILIFMNLPFTSPIYHGPIAFWLSFVMMLLSLLVITVIYWRQITYPMNLVSLLILTICVGVFLGISYVQYQLNEFVMTIGMAAATSLVLLLFLVQSKIDLTILIGVILVVATNLLMIGILALAVPAFFLPALYSALVALPFLLYIIFDSYLVVTGRPRRSVLIHVYGLEKLGRNMLYGYENI